MLPCSNISLLFVLFPTVRRKRNYFVNFYWDNKYSDSDLFVAGVILTQVSEALADASLRHSFPCDSAWYEHRPAATKVQASSALGSVTGL